MAQPHPTRPVVIRSHEQSGQLVYLDVAPDLSSLMGRFQPARYVGARQGAYVLAELHLEVFRRFCEQHHLLLIDERGEPAMQRPPGRDRPLPECASCGQPAQRGARLTHCPNCARPWRAVEVDSRTALDDSLRTACPKCAADQRSGFAYCVRCGAALPTKHQQWERRQQQHGEQQPLDLGAAIDELAAQQQATGQWPKRET